MKRKVLMLASVASMIDQFNMPNIEILKEIGYEVYVACNFKLGNTSSLERVKEFKKEMRELNIKYFQIDFSRSIRSVKANLKAYRQVEKLLLRDRFEFIHCHSPIGGMIGRLVGHKTNTKVIYTAHGFHFFKGAPIRNWLLYYPVEKWLARYTDVLITINREDYERAKRKFKAKNITLIKGVGIELNKFNKQTEELKLSTRKTYGYSSNDFIMIAIGELNRNKHQDLLIDVVTTLKDKIPNIKLLLVGIGSMKEQYEKKIKNIDIENNVQILGFRTDINNLLILSDLAVSASKREGLPVNILESMAVGLPLVVTDCRGNRDLVNNGNNGFIVKLNEIDEFAEKIEMIYASLELREFMKKNNENMVKNYCIEMIGKNVRKIYKKIGNINS